MSGSTLDRALEVQATGVDRTNGLERSYRLGWRKSVGLGDVQIGSDGFGSPGGFGTVVWADPEYHLGFGYVRTLCVTPKLEYRADRLLGEIVNVLESPRQ